LEHTVRQPVAAEQRRGVGVRVVGQGQLTRQARLVEDERAAGQLGAHPGVGKVVVQPVLDATVRCAQAIGEAAAQFTLPGEDRRNELRRLCVLDLGGQRQAELRKTEVDGGILDRGHAPIVVNERPGRRLVSPRRTRLDAPAPP
jgi:hypothetical protein